MLRGNVFLESEILFSNPSNIVLKIWIEMYFQRLVAGRKEKEKRIVLANSPTPNFFDKSALFTSI